MPRAPSEPKQTASGTGMKYASGISAYHFGATLSKHNHSVTSLTGSSKRNFVAEM